MTKEELANSRIVQQCVGSFIHPGLPQIENDTEWGPRSTLRINLNFTDPLSQGTYLDKVVIPIGVSDEHFFSM